MLPLKALSQMIGFITGKNPTWAPKDLILDQLTEKRPLPIGMTEFEQWSDRIISGAMIPATPESQKFTLANMVLHLGPTEAYKEDGYFINSLRKYAANQIADAKRNEIRDAAKARLEAEQKQDVTPVQPQSEVTQTDSGVTREVLENH